MLSLVWAKKTQVGVDDHRLMLQEQPSVGAARWGGWMTKCARRDSNPQPTG